MFDGERGCHKLPVPAGERPPHKIDGTLPLRPDHLRGGGRSRGCAERDVIARSSCAFLLDRVAAKQVPPRRANALQTNQGSSSSQTARTALIASADEFPPMSYAERAIQSAGAVPWNMIRI